MKPSRRYILPTTVFSIVVGLMFNLGGNGSYEKKHFYIATENATSVVSTIITQDSRGTEMVYVPGGTFTMGITQVALADICIKIFKASDQRNCDDTANVLGNDNAIFQTHIIDVAPFWIDQYEATIAQYQACFGPGVTSCREIDLSDNPQLTNDPQKPQVGVDWYDAVLFCNGRGARLSTEAEWEYVAKGPQNNVFPWGNSLLTKYLEYSNGSYPVGDVPANKSWIGIYDLSGNVSQWVEDRFQPYLPTALGAETFSLDDTSRVIRGGSWMSRGLHLINVYRTGLDPNSQYNDVGVRCARTTDPRK